ncbi:hypothetical protein AVEN_162876-1 [Araneus ventricosus]|uniref:RING-type domain-containing protein n=1 Tax=Araneus ventricosus TaxID=182803 RepID=A0A4Y2T932_ARAVE|nr:hypothetical protein AVEN_162876-1 [Araneus ventricosus]
MGLKRKESAESTKCKDAPTKRKRVHSSRGKAPAPSQGKEKVAECCVCLDTTRCRKMKPLRCSHSFHERCINSWLERNKTCPLCRMSVYNCLFAVFRL